MRKVITAWQSNPAVKSPWYEVIFDRERTFNAITDTGNKPSTRKYRLEHSRYCP